MAAESGRELLILDGTGPVAAGIQTKAVTINNEPVDITSDDDDGFRTMLEEAGVRSAEVSISGVAKDANFITAIQADSHLTLSVVIGNVATLSADWHVTSVAINGETGGAITFDATLQSSGEITVS